MERWYCERRTPGTSLKIYGARCFSVTNHTEFKCKSHTKHTTFTAHLCFVFLTLIALSIHGHRDFTLHPRVVWTNDLPFCWKCLERGGGWRGDHTRQLKPKTLYIYGDVMFPCRTTTWCTNQFSYLKAVEISAAKIAMDRDCSKLRMKQLPQCGMVLDRTILLSVEHYRDSRRTIKSEIILNTLHSPLINRISFLQSERWTSMEVER